jgi:hypothetical protein
MTSQGEILARIVRHLDALGISHMVVGSLASSYHGEPRTTQDIDIVIDPTPDALDRLVEALAADGLYVDAAAAVEAHRQRSAFNVIDPVSGWKLDLILRRDRPFSVEELSRRLPARLLGSNTFVATPEDTIIAKLEWAKAGESERQLRDVASIIAISGEGLDLAYVVRWVDALELTDQWERARALAREDE